jgi:tetratricopeptide (TPR) repeat protein
VLLDRERVKTWQKWIFGLMAVIMVAFLVMIPLRGMACGNAVSSAMEQIEADIAKYQAALQTNPDDVAALRNLADTYILRANQQEAGSDAQKSDWRLAIAEYEKAVVVLAKQKGADARQLRVETLEQIANVYLFLNDYQKAANVYARITDLTPKDAQAYFDWATVAVSAGDTNVALLAFSKFLELDPESPQADDVRAWIEENTPNPTASPSPSSSGGSGS